MRPGTVRLLLATVLLFGCALREARSEDNRPSFAESVAFHSALRGANVATTRWSIQQGAQEANPWMVRHLEGKQAGIAVALSIAETRLSRKHRRVLRAVHLIGTGVTCWLDVRAGKRARSAQEVR